jgi:beta-1,4-mannosyltransferase
MFGAGLPVCAVRYDCIDELVAEGETGLLFDSPEQLAQQLQQLLRGFGGRQGTGSGNGSGGSSGQLEEMRAAVKRVHDGWRWDSNWRDVAAPVIAAACRRQRPTT